MSRKRCQTEVRCVEAMVVIGLFNVVVGFVRFIMIVNSSYFLRGSIGDNQVICRAQKA